jgi:2-haloacid dehalogenase
MMMSPSRWGFLRDRPVHRIAGLDGGSSGAARRPRTNSSGDLVGITRLPRVRATKLSTFAGSRLNTAIGKPLRSMFIARFSPITASPIMPMLALPAAASEVAIRILPVAGGAVAAWCDQAAFILQPSDGEQFHSSRRRRGRIEGVRHDRHTGLRHLRHADRHRRHQSRARAHVGDRAALRHRRRSSSVRLSPRTDAAVPRLRRLRAAFGLLLPAFRAAIPDAGPGAERLTARCRRSPTPRAFALRASVSAVRVLDGTVRRHRRAARARGIAHHFAGVVSLQAPRLYKPGPAAYEYFLRETGITAADAWLVSGNPFDVLGAVGAGINGAWVKRSPDAVLDPWEIAPTLVAEDLPALCDALRARCRPA